MIINPIERIELKRAYMDTFGTPQGQKVLAHILKVAGVTSPRFTTDNEQTRINEGERRLAMSIFKHVHGSMDGLLKQIQEQVALEEKQNNP